MEPSELVKLSNKVNDLEETIQKLKTQINEINIDRQFYLTAEDNMLPGMATKVVYDKNGLITRGEKLGKNDIPNLDIDHIDGLRDLVNNKVSKTEFSRFRSIVDQAIPKKGNISNTGTKINYDSNGLVISSSDLLLEDIPDIPIDKVSGLSEKLDSISIEAASAVNDEIEHPNVSANTFTKVTYDNHGHILQGDKLSIDDIPQELIIKINEAESKILSVASSKKVELLSNKVDDKLDANPVPMKSGIYTKVQVDSKGLVVNSYELTKEDLPSLSVDDIQDLREALKNKADYESIAETNALATTLVEKISAVGNIQALQNDIKRKADANEVADMKNDIKFLKDLVNRTIEKAPLDMITPQFNDILSTLSNIEGRLSAIEFQLNDQ